MIALWLILALSIGCAVGNVVAAQRLHEQGAYRTAVDHEFYSAVWLVVALCAGGWLLI